jgi:protein TonB
MTLPKGGEKYDRDVKITAIKLPQRKEKPKLVPPPPPPPPKVDQG